MLELLSGYNHVLPFLAHTLLVFLAETEQESMAKMRNAASSLLTSGRMP